MPPTRTTPKGYERARQLRKEPTPAEAKLWAALRRNKLDGINFRRQHAIGNYVVDFCSPKKKLVIEVDGGGHVELEEYDQTRTKYLESQGYRVLRFWNREVMGDLVSVIKTIQIAIDD